MFAFAGNALIALIVVGVFLGGGALFFIARQDDSHAGQVIGLLLVAASLSVFLGLSAGHHWL